MKLSTYLSIILTLLIALSYSQTISPSIQITGNDTAVLIPLKDVKVYNHIMVDLDACIEINDSLYSQVHNLELSGKQKNDIILTDNIMISKLGNQVAEKIITEDSYKKEAKKNNNKLKLFKGLLGLVSVVAIVEGGVIGIQSLKY